MTVLLSYITSGDFIMFELMHDEGFDEFEKHLIPTTSNL